MTGAWKTDVELSTLTDLYFILGQLDFSVNPCFLGTHLKHVIFSL